MEVICYFETSDIFFLNYTDLQPIRQHISRPLLRKNSNQIDAVILQVSHIGQDRNSYRLHMDSN
jgi:hypothetical protein